MPLVDNNTMYVQRNMGRVRVIIVPVDKQWVLHIVRVRL